MAYRFQRDTARDRVRSVVGDTSDPPILAGGEGAYDAILAVTGTSEHRAARTAARDLAAQLSKAPSSLSDAGSALAWSERIAFLLKLATGELGTGLTGDPALAGSPSAATGVSLRGRPRPDYTLAAGDTVAEDEV